ncbi:hypothetical protein Dimus_016401 [Dionaea muscipula]
MGRVKVHKTLEITRRFANDATIMKAEEYDQVEMKPSQRFIHFLVMKNVIPRFGKRDTSSFLDLTYMDHLMARRLVNPPRVMMRHMSYVISMKDHESPHGDWLTLVFEAFGVPLEVVRIEEGMMMRRLQEEGAEGDDEGNKNDFDWEAVIDEATVEGESGSGEKFYDAEEDAQGSPELPDEIPADTTPSSVQQKDKGIAGVDPSGPTSREADFLKFRASLNERGQTNFMMNWRRPKSRMPNF